MVRQNPWILPNYLFHEVFFIKLAKYIMLNSQQSNPPAIHLAGFSISNKKIEAAYKEPNIC